MRSKNSPIDRTFADEARRKQIVGCAIEVIAEKGFAQASLARIAERARVAKSVVLYHFANKNELVEQVLMAVSMASAAPLPERMAAAGGARDKLRVAIETIAEFVDGNRTYALAGLETWNQTRSLPGRARLAEDPAAAGVEDIRRLLTEGQACGELGEFDPHVVAVMFRQAVDAITLEAAIDPTADLTAFAAQLAAMFDRMISP